MLGQAPGVPAAPTTEALSGVTTPHERYQETRSQPLRLRFARAPAGFPGRRPLYAPAFVAISGVRVKFYPWRPEDDRA